MKTIVLYYTFGGSSKAEAEKLANETGASLCRVEEKKKRGMLSAVLSGSPKAMKRVASEIKPIAYHLEEFERIVIGGPIWAGYPAPAINAILNALPHGKEVELFFCSGGGDSTKSVEGTKALVEQKGCKLISYRDVKTGQGMKKTKE